MIQVLHGVCFAIILVASLEYLYRIVPPEMQATGHMMYVAISFGVTGIIGSSLGGMVFEAFGGSTLYLLLSGIALIGGIGLIISYRFLKQAKPITPDSLN
jgi:predicted MFS family arabinose efflux permease